MIHNSNVIFFREYQSSLELACEDGANSRYGMLNWTVQAYTPDTVYYQSFTHEVVLFYLLDKVNL